MKRVIKRGLPVLAAGLVVAGGAAVTLPASAATELYRATLTVTLVTEYSQAHRKPNSVVLETGGGSSCHSGFVKPKEGKSQPRDIAVAVRPGQTIRVSSSLSCYNSIATTDVTITSDGQRIAVSL